MEYEPQSPVSPSLMEQGLARPRNQPPAKSNPIAQGLQLADIPMARLSNAAQAQALPAHQHVTRLATLEQFCQSLLETMNIPAEKPGEPLTAQDQTSLTKELAASKQRALNLEQTTNLTMLKRLQNNTRLAGTRALLERLQSNEALSATQTRELLEACIGKKLAPANNNKLIAVIGSAPKAFAEWFGFIQKFSTDSTKDISAVFNDVKLIELRQQMHSWFDARESHENPGDADKASAEAREQFFKSLQVFNQHTLGDIQEALGTKLVIEDLEASVEAAFNGPSTSNSSPSAPSQSDLCKNRLERLKGIIDAVVAEQTLKATQAADKLEKITAGITQSIASFDSATNKLFGFYASLNIVGRFARDFVSGSKNASIGIQISSFALILMSLYNIGRSARELNSRLTAAEQKSDMIDANAMFQSTSVFLTGEPDSRAVATGPTGAHNGAGRAPLREPELDGLQTRATGYKRLDINLRIGGILAGTLIAAYVSGFLSDQLDDIIEKIGQDIAGMGTASGPMAASG